MLSTEGVLVAEQTSQRKIYCYVSNKNERSISPISGWMAWPRILSSSIESANASIFLQNWLIVFVPTIKELLMKVKSQLEWKLVLKLTDLLHSHHQKQSLLWMIHTGLHTVLHHYHHDHHLLHQLSNAAIHPSILSLNSKWIYDSMSNLPLSFKLLRRRFSAHTFRVALQIIYVPVSIFKNTGSK